MADAKISDLSAAAALAGADLAAGVQGGANVKISMDLIKAYCRDYGEAVLFFAAGSPNTVCTGGRHPVRTAAGVWYEFYVDGSFAYLWYQKSTDYGRTWGAPVQITAVSTRSFAVWFDQWTPGDAGTRIHLAWLDLVNHDVGYRELQTSTDTLGTARVAYAGTSLVTGEDTCVSITKSVAGRILIGFDIDGGTETGFTKSDDFPVTAFTAKANLNEATSDYYQLYPSNLADTADIWALFLDRSAGELTLKTYDDSGDSWSESAALTTGITNLAGNAYGSQFSGTVRLSDGHLFALLWNNYDNAAADLMAWDINGAGSITARTNVITNTDDCAFCAIVDDVTGATETLYAFYGGKADGSETFQTISINYKTSTDDGATWSAEQSLGVTARFRAGLFACPQAEDGEFVIESNIQENGANLISVFPLT